METGVEDKRLKLAREWFPNLKVVWEGHGGRVMFLRVGGQLVTRCDCDQSLEKFTIALKAWFPDTAARMEAMTDATF